MKRRVIIITNAGKVGSENYCQGVYKDKENYISFLKSGYGGYYSDSEIRYLDKPSREKVREELSLLTKNEIEFSIIVFCGHGWYSTMSESNIFELNDNGDLIDSLELRTNAKKRIIIEDNCREPYSEYITDNLIKSFSAGGLFEEYHKRINPEECKKYYNKKISECPEQVIIGQACSIGETAGDSSSTGGYYSSCLLKKTKEMVESGLITIDLSSNYSTYSFPFIHNLAVPVVQKRSGNKQNPQIEKPRYSVSDNYLPFAVIA